MFLVGQPISTGVRGRTSIGRTDTTFVALDHDMNRKGSLTPSVTLQCDIPDDIAKSFYQGNVRVTVNDSIYQSSSPWRHTAGLLNIIDEDKKVLIKFSDGGTDHRHTLEAVRLCLIVLFKVMNLDALIAGRCAPGFSFTNPAERCMATLNLALQNCALER